MASDWLDVQLQDVVSKLGDGLHGTPKYSEDGEYYFINGNNLENGKIVFKDTTKRVNKEQYLKYKKTLNDRTLLVSINGTIGNIAYYNSEKVVLGKSACYFNLKDDIDKSYVRYVLSGHYFQSYINTFATGTTIKNISLKTMREFSFKLPYLPEQKAIAHFLGTLDNKIELNRQMNQTLESMAQTLFKSWFVDFDPVIDNALAAGNPIPDALKAKAGQRADQLKAATQSGTLPTANRKLFPSEFTFTEELGWIPKGWEVKKLCELIDLTGGGTPKTSVEEYWSGEIPWFSVVDAPSQSDLYVLDTEKHVTQLGVDKSSTKILNFGTTIISARGTVGKCAMVSRPTAMNQSCYGINGKEGIADIYTYYSVLINISDLQQKAHGSVFNTITTNTFSTIHLPFGGEKLTLAFDANVESFFKKILLNGIQAQNLAKLRDTLLPKLLSGELRIAEAAALVEGV